MKIRGSLRSRGLKLDQAHTLSSLGVLSLLPADTGDIAQQIDETGEMLRMEKGCHKAGAAVIIRGHCCHKLCRQNQKRAF